MAKAKIQPGSGKNDAFVDAREKLTLNRAKSYTHWGPLLFLWLLVTVYNLFKPYHIDDTAHLEIAQWISRHPLHPMSGLLNWRGVDEAIWHTNQPHLYFYILALWGSVFGYSEPAMHSLQSLFSLMCILSFYRLAFHLIRPIALWATAILVLGPAFVVEQNLMVDIPLLATWLFFFHIIIVGVDSCQQHRRYMLAGIASAAALLIKYSSLILFVVFCFSLLLERRKAQAWTILIPVAALAAWSLFNIWDYGSVHIATRPQESHPPSWFVREAGTWVLAVGSLSPLGMIIAVQNRFGSNKIESRMFLAASVAFATLVLAVTCGVLSDRSSDYIFWFVFMINGLLTGILLILTCLNIINLQLWQPETAHQNASQVYLLLWFSGTTVFYILFSPFVAARHVLLILPALLLLLSVTKTLYFTQASRVFGLGLTVAVSAGLCTSDWHFANFYKQAAARVAQSPDTKGIIWVSGHWGWQWYATQNGLRQVDIYASQLQSGDELVVADNVDHQSLKNLTPLRLLRTETDDRPLLSLFCTGRKAQFYSSTLLEAPWSLSRNCGNQISVYKVEDENLK